MIIAPYYRVSKSDHERGVSIDIQRDTCERWVSHNAPGAALLPPYIDDGKSAFSDDLTKRPAFKRLIDDAKARMFDMVLVYRFDRFARRRRVYFSLIDELADTYKIAVKSATESDDWLTVGINGLLSEQYSRMLSERMSDVARFGAQRGRWGGGIPYGYDLNNGKLIPNAAEAANVRLVFELYATNAYGVNDIVDELCARGLVRSSRYCNDGEPYLFNRQSVRRILDNSAYIGSVHCKDIVVPNAHEPIIDLATWNTVREIRDRRNIHKGRITIKAPERGILTGLVRCTTCGGPMWHTRNVKGLRYYRCARIYYGQGCQNRPGAVNAVDRIALDLLSQMTLPADWEAEAIAMVKTDHTPTRPDAARLERELRKLRTEFVEGAISVQEYQQRETALRVQQVSRPGPSVVDLSAAARLLRDLPTLIQNATPDEQRALFSTIFESVWLRASVIEAWAPRTVYVPLLASLYTTKEIGEALPQHLPHLWQSHNTPIVLGGAR